jgi:hypothetical protein
VREDLVINSPSTFIIQSFASVHSSHIGMLTAGASTQWALRIAASVLRGTL